MTDTINRKIVLGLGNTLNKDEGLGVFAVSTLETHLKERLGNNSEV